MGVGPAVVTDVPQGTTYRSVPNGSADGVVTQDGLHVSVHMANHCDVQRIDKVERTTVREHQNLAPQNDWWAGIGGTVIAGVGVAAVASPSTMQPKDGSASEAEVRGSGYALIGVGALLLAVPVIDYVRAHREAEHKVERLEEPGPVVQPNVRCGAREGAEVTVRHAANGRVVVLGRTDANGALDASLDASVPASWSLTKDSRLALTAGDTSLGEVSLSQVFAVREEAAWHLAETNECSSSLDVSACDAQVAYARDYPEGPHIDEARKAVDAAQSRRRLAADEASWTKVNPGACRTPAKNDIGTIEAACAPVEHYLAEYPDGLHAEAAREALKPARTLLARLEEVEVRRQRVQEQESSGMFIPYAGNGGGPTVCADGMISHSSGRGTCSHHGGVAGGSSYRSRGGGSHRSSGHSRRK